MFVNNVEYIENEIKKAKVVNINKKHVFFINTIFFLFVVAICMIVSISSTSEYKVYSISILTLLLGYNVVLSYLNRVIIFENRFLQNGVEIDLTTVDKIYLRKQIIFKKRYEVVLVIITKNSKNEKIENVIRIKNILFYSKMIKLILLLSGKEVEIEN